MRKKLRSLRYKVSSYLNSKKLPSVLRRRTTVYAAYFIFMLVLATVMWTKWSNINNRYMSLDPELYDEDYSANVQSERPSTPVDDNYRDNTPIEATLSEPEASVGTEAEQTFIQTTPPVDPAVEIEAALAPNEIWQLPLNGQPIKRFGMFRSQTTNDWRMHNGIDLEADLGAEIVAARSGTVQKVERTSELGWKVTLVHPGSFQTIYACCDKIMVNEGQVVKVGIPIATVGRTALLEFAEGPHLHFEVLIQGEHTNPEQVLLFRKDQ